MSKKVIFLSLIIVAVVLANNLYFEKASLGSLEVGQIASFAVTGCPAPTGVGGTTNFATTLDGRVTITTTTYDGVATIVTTASDGGSIVTSTNPDGSATTTTTTSEGETTTTTTTPGGDTGGGGDAPGGDAPAAPAGVTAQGKPVNKLSFGSIYPVGTTYECGIGIGACTGTTVCQKDNSWSTCTAPAPASMTEICGNAIDDDCDMTIDEGCECVEGTTKECGTNLGTCIPGKETCKKGEWGPCLGGVMPTKEICGDGLDNDCDGITDNSCECTNGQTKKCGIDEGACKSGTQTCINGLWSSCMGSVEPTTESCFDNIDNDCDGVVNNNCMELCDGVDNDNDGAVDEDCPRPCEYLSATALVDYSTVSALVAFGSNDKYCCPAVDAKHNFLRDSTHCFRTLKDVSSRTYLIVRSNYLAASTACKEICGDKIDNDCDGVVDNGCGGEEGVVFSVYPDILKISIKKGEIAEYNIVVSNLGNVEVCPSAILPQKFPLGMVEIKRMTGGGGVAGAVTFGTCVAVGQQGLYKLKIDTTLSNVTPKTYTGTVVVHGSGEEGLDLEIIVGGETSPPAPTNLAAMCQGNTSVSLTWTAVEGATSYNVYRGFTSGGETKIAQDITGTSYNNTGLIAGTTYYYYVTAVAGTAESAPSNEVSITCGAGDKLLIINITPADGATNVCLPTVSGTVISEELGGGVAGALVTLYIDSELHGQVFTDASGNFEINVCPAVNDAGPHTFNVTASKAGYTNGTLSGSWSVINNSENVCPQPQCDGGGNQLEVLPSEVCGVAQPGGIFQAELTLANNSSGSLVWDSEITGNSWPMSNDPTTGTLAASSWVAVDLVVDVPVAPSPSDDGTITFTSGSYEDSAAIKVCTGMSEEECCGSSFTLGGISANPQDFCIAIHLGESASDQFTVVNNGVETITVTSSYGCFTGSLMWNFNPLLTMLAPYTEYPVTFDTGIVDYEGYLGLNTCIYNMENDELGIDVDVPVNIEVLAEGEEAQYCINEPPPPETEICDGIDNDYDGKTDENPITDEIPWERTCNGGGCGQGTQQCLNGAWTECSGSDPVDEVCNGIDDDCDGDIDESLAKQCGSNIGECEYGQSSCSAGEWGSCIGGTNPITERCNDGKDNDCDGSTDEGCGNCQNGDTGSCGIDRGICKSGTQTCTNETWGECIGDITPMAEICGDGLDNDCDGSIDEGCGCNPGDSKNCGTKVGLCDPGTQSCVNEKWEECYGARFSEQEKCDDTKDNDCDGSIDEGCIEFQEEQTATGGTAEGEIKVTSQPTIAIGEIQTIYVNDATTNAVVAGANVIVVKPSGSTVSGITDIEGKIAFQIDEVGEHQIEAVKGTSSATGNFTALDAVSSLLSSGGAAGVWLFGSSFTEAPWLCVLLLILSLIAGITAYYVSEAYFPKTAKPSSQRTLEKMARLLVAAIFFVLPLAVNFIAGSVYVAIVFAIIEIAALFIMEYHKNKWDRISSINRIFVGKPKLAKTSPRAVERIK